MASGMVILEEDVVDVVDESDIKVVAEIQPDVSEEVELVEEVIPTPVPEVSPTLLNLPDSPTDQHENIPEAPAPPPLNMPVVCPSCSSRFEVAMGNSSASCPVCDERIVL